jgi:apolipoprotein N-acyltransferase
MALAYPPVPLFVVVFVALAPLLVFIVEWPPGPAGRWSATRAGILTGLVYFGIKLYWIVVALLPETPLAVPAWALTVGVLAGFSGAFAWAIHFSRERLNLPLVAGAALFWTTLEWLPGRFGDLAYPWLGLGYALAPFPRMAGAADLVGARGLTLWIAAVNGLLAMAVVAFRAGSGRRAVGGMATAAVALFAVPVGYGTWRAATLEMRPAARVAVVQPNIPQAVRRDHAGALATSRPVLARLTVRAAGQESARLAVAGQPGIGMPDLYAWPEVALTTDLAGDPELVEEVSATSGAAGAPILVGAFGRDGDDRYNSAFLITAYGPAGPRYDKRRLVAFVERAPRLGPVRMPAALRPGNVDLGLEVGRDGPLFQAGGSPFGVLICFESVFPELARRYRLDGADFLVNITNDAWFGGDAGSARTSALWQHPAHLTLRAIETRTGIARAANTGISMFIDPLGRTSHQTSLSARSVAVATVLTTSEITVYTRWGDWLPGLAAAAAGVVLLVAVGRSRPRRRADRSGAIGPTAPFVR